MDRPIFIQIFTGLKARDITAQAKASLRATAWVQVRRQLTCKAGIPSAFPIDSVVSSWLSLASMPEHPRKAHPQNVAGPFYVEDGCCLICDVPRSVAPDMFKYTTDKSHCFVYKQPETAADLQKMLEVLKTQDVMCIRCRSRDGSLLELLSHQDLAEVCDFKSYPP